MKLSKRFSGLRPDGMTKIFEAAGSIKDIVNLSIGEPDFNTEPEIIDAAANGAKDGYTHYPPLQGYLDVREAVCHYWERHHSFKCNPDEVQMMVGGIQSAWLALQAILDPGDEVICVEPCFGPYFAQVEWNGGKAIHLPTDEANNFAATPEAIEDAVTPKTKVLMLCSPSNPTGRVMSREQMEKIAVIVEKHDLFVLSDEIYESLVFKGKHIPFAAIDGMRDRTLIMSGLSKSHCMTGWRLGYAIGPKQLIKVMLTLSASQTFGLSTIGQRGALYALDRQDAKLEERRGIFRSRLDYVAERLNKIKGITCAKADGAFYLFPNIKGTGKTSEEFVWALLNDTWKVALMPGNAFGACGDGYVRIACTQSMETLVKGMDRIEKAVASF